METQTEPLELDEAFLAALPGAEEDGGCSFVFKLPHGGGDLHVWRHEFGIFLVDVSHPDWPEGTLNVRILDNPKREQFESLFASIYAQ
jgi:hypothetical protein